MSHLHRFKLRGLVFAWLLGVAHDAGRVHADSGVAAGNLDGESPTIGAMAGGGGQVLPLAPSLFSAIRLDKDKVQITLLWEIEQPGDVLRIMRAKDDAAWQMVDELTGLPEGPEWRDADAPANHDYRYVAIVVGQRAGRASSLVASDLSNEVRVADIGVAIEIASAITTGPVEGSLIFNKFLPESFTSANDATAPDPFESEGPYADTLLYGYDVRGVRTDGFLKRGEASSYKATITGFGGTDVWAHMAVSDWWLFQELKVETPPGGGLSIEGDVMVPDLIFDGNPAKGFDGRSNPKWQMLPQGGGAEVTVRVPSLPALTPEHAWSPEVLIGSKPTVLECAPMPLTATTTTIAHIGGPVGEQRLTQHLIRPNPPNTEPNYPSPYFPFVDAREFQEVETIRGTLGVDIRPPQTVSVGLYPVYYRRRGPMDPPEGRRIPTYSITKEMPTKAALENKLNRIYGDGANVWFTVTIEEPIEFDAGEDPDGDEMCLKPAEAGSFQLKADTDSYRISIFVFDVGGWAWDFAGTPVSSAHATHPTAAEVNEISGNYVFTDWPQGKVDVLAHEVGHCLGLRHAFQIENNPASTALIPDISSSRIMGYDRTGHDRLIKQERDTIHDNINSQP